MSIQARYQAWLSGGAQRRWLVVVAGVLINTALGVRFAWSVFATPLATEFHWTAVATTAPLLLNTTLFAILMIPAGRWADRAGPTPVGLTGALLMGLGFTLSSVAPYWLTSADVAWLWIMLTHGVLTGAATALAFSISVATTVRWFPERRGLVTGLCVFGCGLSTVVFGPLANTLILTTNIWTTFFQLGILFAVMICLGALLLVSPPANWSQARSDPSIAAYKHAHRVEPDLSPHDLVRMKESYLLIAMFACSTAAGLMVISFAKGFLDLSRFNQLAQAQGLGWIRAVPVIGFDVLTGHAAELSAAMVGWLALWNALGRLIVGWVADQIGLRRALVVNVILTTLVMLLMPRLTDHPWAMLWMYLLVGLTFGGTVTIFPALTADWFGSKHAGANYGVIFLGWGLGGVIGPLVGNWGLEALGSYQTGFMCAAGLAALAAVLAFCSRGRVSNQTFETDGEMASGRTLVLSDLRCGSGYLHRRLGRHRVQPPFKRASAAIGLQEGRPTA